MTPARRSALLLGGGLVALSLLCGWIAWDGLSEPWRGFRAGAASLTVRTGAGAAAAAGVSLAAVAALVVPGTTSPRYQRIMFGVALAATPFLLILPLALLLLTPPLLERDGYRRCDAPGASQRFAGQRWCRGGEIADAAR